MKKICVSLLLSSMFTILTCKITFAQTSPAKLPTLEISNPWTDSQLIEPSLLAGTLGESASNHPLIFNIGAVEDIKDAKHIGPVSKTENIEKLRSAVAGLPKNTEIVIYCGCCPFAKCPNIRPAFTELKKLGFTNVRVLDIPVNLKTNWIAKGYPLAASH